jgi:hypothetical protein
MRDAKRDASLDVTPIEYTVYNPGALAARRHEDVVECSVCSE